MTSCCTRTLSKKCTVGCALTWRRHELELQDPEHVAYIYGLFGVLPGHEAESGLGNYYAAQTVWDETMADAAAAWLGAGVRAHPTAPALLPVRRVFHSGVSRRMSRRSPALAC